jgi:hypothetical protein
MEITDVTKQTHELAAIIRQAVAEAGYSYEGMTFASAEVVERATKLVASEARGWAWQNGPEQPQISPIAARMLDSLLPPPPSD